VNVKLKAQNCTSLYLVAMAYGEYQIPYRGITLDKRKVNISANESIILCKLLNILLTCTENIIDENVRCELR